MLGSYNKFNNKCNRYDWFLIQNLFYFKICLFKNSNSLLFKNYWKKVIITTGLIIVIGHNWMEQFMLRGLQVQFMCWCPYVGYHVHSDLILMWHKFVWNFFCTSKKLSLALFHIWKARVFQFYHTSLFDSCPAMPSPWRWSTASQASSPDSSYSRFWASWAWIEMLPSIKWLPKVGWIDALLGLNQFWVVGHLLRCSVDCNVM